MRWTGNGVADGTNLTAGNVNTAGNGDTVARATAFSPTMNYRGNGFEFTGGTNDIGRLDANMSTTKAMLTQCIYTPTSTCSGGDFIIGIYSSVGGKACTLSITASDAFAVGYVGGQTASSPAFSYGDRFLIDLLAAQSPVQTTSNGRTVCRVTNLTSPTWNTTGTWYQDTGYTINLTTSDLGGNSTSVRFGKQGIGDYTGNLQLIEQLGWDYATIDPSYVVRSQVETYFMTAPAASSWLAA